MWCASRWRALTAPATGLVRRGRAGAMPEDGVAVEGDEGVATVHEHHVGVLHPGLLEAGEDGVRVADLLAAGDATSVPSGKLFLSPARVRSAVRGTERRRCRASGDGDVRRACWRRRPAAANRCETGWPGCGNRSVQQRGGSRWLSVRGDVHYINTIITHFSTHCLHRIAYSAAGCVWVPPCVLRPCGRAGHAAYCIVSSEEPHNGGTRKRLSVDTPDPAPAI